MRRKWLKTNHEFKAYITGKLLGDGSITKQVGRRPRFKFKHTYKDFKWCWHCYEELVKTIPLSEPKFQKSIDAQLKKGYSLSYYVQSRTSDIICYLRKKWYPNSKKTLPFNLINESFSPQTLAWWYMDDGHFKVEKNIPKKIILSTDGFTITENKWLIDFLYKKYNLLFSLDKQNRIILYDQFQIIYFFNLIKPYMHKSMHRKLLSSRPIHFNIPARRTTIYLSDSIIVTSPTKEINSRLEYLTNIIDSYKDNSFYKKYKQKLFAVPKKQKRSYQIIISTENLSNLKLLKRLTGLNFSQLTELCFSYS